MTEDALVDWEKTEVLLRDWLRRAREDQHSQHEAGKFCRSFNYWLRIPVIVLTTALGTAAFASLEKQVSNSIKMWFGGLSIFAAVLTAISTHFKFFEQSEMHKILGAKYGIIRRDIEAVLHLPMNERESPKVVVDRIRKQFDDIASEGTVVSGRIWKKTVKMLRDKEVPPTFGKHSDLIQ